MFVKAVNRTSEAIEELLAQQRLDGTPGLEVRLSPQNQVFLNTWRPTRAAIPASLMEKLIPGFKARAPAFLTIAFLDKGIRTYHWYSGGKTWVPIVPGSVAHPNDVLHIAIEPLSPQTFLERFPALMLSNEPYLMRNMPDETLLRIRGNGTNFDVIGEQWPAINGLNDFEVRCVATGGLIHQTGSTILPFAIEDAFSVRRQMRLYHNGRGNMQAPPSI
ncbi:MAG: hypothetical protein ABSA72_04165 [Nitrososphaerales archaeon]